MSDELNLPWKIYFFGEDGKYDKRDVIDIPTSSEFMQHSDKIIKHVKSGLEVRLCDSLDYCLMHYENGKRIFPI